MTTRSARHSAASRGRRVGTLLLASALLASPGCMALALGPTMIANKLMTRYKRVEFRIIDAHSGRPISGATVGIDYQGMRGMIPHNVRGVTDDQGRLTLRVAVGNNAWTDVVAPGYLPISDKYVLGLDPLDRVVLPLRPIGGRAAPSSPAATIGP